MIPAHRRLIENGITREEFRVRFGMSEAANNAFFAWERANLKPINIAEKPIVVPNAGVVFDIDRDKLNKFGVKVGTIRRSVAVLLMENPTKEYSIDYIAEELDEKYASVKEACQALKSFEIIQDRPIRSHSGPRKLWRAII